MMKKKVAVLVRVVVALLLFAVLAFGVQMHNRQNDIHWQTAQKLYDLESAIKQVDEDWELASLSTVTPYTYVNAEGDCIVYYHCRTVYLSEDERTLDGMNVEALGEVVDISALENRQECEVNGRAAIAGDLEGKRYLCWTIDSENSCVIEYGADFSAEEDILAMAESVQLP